MLWLIIGISAFYLTNLIRSFIDSDKKPIACDVCMAFWASVLALGTTIFIELWSNGYLLKDINYGVLFNILPSAGVAYFLLKLEEHLSPKPLPNLSFLTDEKPKKDLIIDKYK